MGRDEDIARLRREAETIEKLIKSYDDDSIHWDGDLADDCTAYWRMLILRAEMIDDNVAWWGVHVTQSGMEVSSSDSGRHGSSMDEARAFAEEWAREFWREYSGEDLGESPSASTRFACSSSVSQRM